MNDIYQLLLATFAALDQPMNDIAIKTIAGDLAHYQQQAIAHALTRCRKELRRITLADIIERIPGEHPGPEEAWAMVAKAMNNEAVSLVWTDPMRIAYGFAYNLPDDGVAARMSFKEVYRREVSEARAAGKTPDWSASLGHDKAGRDEAQEQAKALNLEFQQSLALPAPFAPPAIE